MNFIRNGTEAVPACCGVVSDKAITHGTFKSIWPPFHFVHIVAHPLDPFLGAFVCFYGLYYYWVILSTRYQALGQTDDLLLQNPQARTAEVPLLRASPGDVRFPWARLIETFSRDPVAAERVAARIALKKFQRAAVAFYGAEGR